MTWAKLETAAVARALAAIAAEPGDLAEVYFERRVDAEWPPAEARCGLRICSEEGLAVRLVRGDRAWVASRDGITGGELASALRQVARAQPAAMVEPELAVGPLPTVPVATLRSFAGELERAIRRHHVAFPFRLTTRWHRRDLQVVGPRWVPESEREVFYSLDVDLPWGRFGALATALQASEAERAAINAKLHLDEPMWLQYARFLRGLATFDLGESVRRPGTSAVARVLENRHFVGDVLAGMALALAVSSCLCALLRRFGKLAPLGGAARGA